MKSEPTDVNTQRMPFAMLTKEDLLVRSFSDEILKITKFLKIDELDKFEAERYTQYDWYFTGNNEQRKSNCDKILFGQNGIVKLVPRVHITSL